MKTRLAALFFIIAITVLASCKSNDNVFTKKVSTAINVVNASADNINFYVNGTRQNNTSALTPGGQTFYLTVPAGLQNFQIKKDGSPDYLISIPLNLKDSLYHSLYIAGESVDKTLVTIDTLIVDTNKVQLRFVHTTPGAGIFDVKIGDTLKFHSAFKTSSSFLSVGSGLKEIKVFETGSSTPKIDTIVSMSPNKGYTIFTKGTLTGTGSSKFSLGVALNF
ncbi:DUF4397 domain-containing protein [Mucilaginibacter flavidus]|uniref:DUF4397 domain-containing protein n=1 Tax=Mucilaginibacter flavidus TaxID=2949309 RepID=UPI002093F72A|nr:DUF4397 domain-containing protein [Mucilaginibacter flavidus]MCO5945505.1 DUF4397 domain-containing protein [Mucilaginibacter flavidus]